MFGMSDQSKLLDYAPTEIVEFNRDLSLTGRKAVLQAGGKIGKNPPAMALLGDKLYVACIGGRQGEGVFGGVWEADMTNFGTVRLALDFQNVTDKVDPNAGLGAYGIDFTGDGTAFILAGGYDSKMDFKGRLYMIPANELAAGGQAAIGALKTARSFTNASGFSWADGVTWDAKSATVWCMAGTNLTAFGRDGNYKRNFTPLQLGEDIYSVSLFNGGTPEDAGGGGGDDGGGGGGGGCSAGAGGLAALAALCLLTLYGRRKRARN
jgi:hypothetical protein